MRRLIGLILLLATSVQAQDLGFLWYVGNSPTARCDSLVGPLAYYMPDRALWGVAGQGHSLAVLQRTPNFKWFVYNSLTDNASPATPAHDINDEDYQWEQFLIAKGHHEMYESTYLHWGEQTVTYHETPYGNCFGIQWQPGQRVHAYGIITCPGSTCPNIGYPGPACPSGTIVGTFTPSTYNINCPCDYRCPNNDCEGGPCSNYLTCTVTTGCISPDCAGNCTGNCAQSPNYSASKNIYDATTVSASGVRYYVNFSDSLAPDGTRVVGSRNLFRQYYKEFLCQWQMQTVGNLVGSSTLYYDGIWLDNSAYALYNIGNILSGGKIRECMLKPAVPIISNDFTPFYTWYRGTFSASDPTQNNGMLGFIQALNDTFATAAAWHPGGKRLYVAANVAISIDRTYPADIIKYGEFEGSVLAPGADTPGKIWTGASTSRVWVAPSLTGGCSTCPLTPGTYPRSLRHFGNYALYLLTYNGDDIWGMQYNTNPTFNMAANPPGGEFPYDLLWKEKELGYGIMDATRIPQFPGYLGNFTSSPSVVRDTLWSSFGNGVHDKIWSRSFENGLVYVRNRSNIGPTANPGEPYDSLSNRWSYVLPTPPNDSAGQQRMWRKLNMDGTLQSAQLNGGARMWIAGGRGDIYVLKRVKGSACIPDCTKQNQQVVEPTGIPTGKYAKYPIPPSPVLFNDSDAGAANPVNTPDAVDHDITVPNAVVAGDEFWANITVSVGGSSVYTLRTLRGEVSYDSTMVIPLYFDNSTATTFFPDSTCSLPSLSDSTSAGYGMRAACTTHSGSDINKAIRYIQWQKCGTSSEVSLSQSPRLVLGRMRFRAIASGTTRVAWSCGADATNYISAGAHTLLTGRRAFDRLSVGTIYFGHAGFSISDNLLTITGTFDPSTRWPLHPAYAEFASDLGYGQGPVSSDVVEPISLWADTLMTAHIVLNYPNGLEFRGINSVADGWTAGVEDSAASSCAGTRYVTIDFHRPDRVPTNFSGQAFEVKWQSDASQTYAITFCNEASSLELGPGEANSVPVTGRIVYGKPSGIQRWTSHADGAVTFVPRLSIGRGGR